MAQTERNEMERKRNRDKRVEFIKWKQGEKTGQTGKEKKEKDST